MPKPRVLLIGWDAADWKLIKPLLDAGEVPAIEQMVNTGVMGNLSTLFPILSPMLWNSIATGKRPSKHGILGFTEVNPHTRVVSPVLSTSRKVKAIWNMLSQEGYRAHVVNWFASHPVEKINGICISDFFAKMPHNYEAPWSLPEDSIHPESAIKALTELRIHPKELEGDILQMFCPLAHEVDQTKDRRIQMLANLIAEAVTIHAAATHIIEHEEWDFVAVYYGSIDHFCHAFMSYHPPQMSHVSDEDFRRYRDVVPNAYRFHDRMLARLLQLAGEDTTVIICSDHGFHSDHLRPTETPAVPAGPAYWHRDQGIIMMRGPNILQDELIHGANLLDITPTVLQAFGLPIGRDMDGRPLIEAFKQVGNIETIDSWESRKGEYPDGMHSGNVQMTRDQADAILEQFIALGYIDRPDKDADKAVAQTNRENQWNLARSHMRAGEIHLAIPILEVLVDESPDRRDFTLTLANGLQYYGLNAEAEALIRSAVPNDLDNEGALHTLAELALSRGETDVALDYLARLAAMDPAVRASGAGLTSSRFLTLGATYAKLRRWTDAISNYEKALTVDPELARAHLGIAHCHLRMRRYEKAVESALTSVELQHHLGPAHFQLALALLRTGRIERSIDAAHTALRYIPHHERAHRLLAIAYQKLPGFEKMVEFHTQQATSIRTQRQTGNPEFQAQREEIGSRIRARLPRLEKFYQELNEKEAKLAQEAEEAKKNPEIAANEKATAAPKLEPFVIVSGLPRSGTSLMMNMLRAGGMEVMTDGERKADEDNPEGYLEWEAIRKIKQQPELIEQARGKVTKVISMLLPDLPRQQRYKVIFVLRPIEEIVASQQKMIARRGTKGATLNAEQLTASLTRHREEILKVISNLPMELLLIRYHKILEDPEAVVGRVLKFLGPERLPNADAMSSVIRKDLYRNRIPSKEADGTRDAEAV